MTDRATAAPARHHDGVAGNPLPPPLTRWIVGVAAVVPGLLALVAARFTRPTVGPDAVSYIAVADSLRAGDGLGFFLERPLTTWPPGWPLLLAAGEAVTGWRGDLVGLALNCVLLVGVVLTGAALGRRVLGHRSMRYVQLAGLAVSPLLVGLAVIVQTEVAFVLGSTLVLVLLLRGTAERRRGWLAAAGAVVAVGFAIRYQAIYVVPVLAGWLLVRSWVERWGTGEDRRGALRDGLVDAIWFSVPAVVPSVAWMIRNRTVSDTFMGPRFPSDVGLVENVAAGIRTQFKFLSSIPVGPGAGLTLLGVVALVVLLGGLWVQGRAEGPGTARRVAATFARPVGLLVTFVVGFTALMAVSRSVVGFDDLDIRLLAPCIVPVGVLFLRWLEVVLIDPGRLRRLGWVGAGGWLAVQVLVTLLLIGPANSLAGDAGYNAPRAVAASSSPALDLLPEGCVLYSNNAADLYRGGTEAQLSPRVVEYKSSQRTRQLEDLVERVEDGERACLIWFEYVDDDENYSRDAMSEVLDLRELGSADEVTVYEIRPRA